MIDHEKEFIKNGGKSCPYCGCKGIKLKGTEPNIKYKCDDCGKKWKRIYKLVGFKRTIN